jgi:hypothetical protein
MSISVGGWCSLLLLLGAAAAAAAAEEDAATALLTAVLLLLLGRSWCEVKNTSSLLKLFDEPLLLWSPTVVLGATRSKEFTALRVSLLHQIAVYVSRRGLYASVVVHSH